MGSRYDDDDRARSPPRGSYGRSPPRGSYGRSPPRGSYGRSPPRTKYDDAPKYDSRDRRDSYNRRSRSPAFAHRRESPPRRSTFGDQCRERRTDTYRDDRGGRYNDRFDDRRERGGGFDRRDRNGGGGGFDRRGGGGGFDRYNDRRGRGGGGFNDRRGGDRDRNRGPKGREQPQRTKFSLLVTNLNEYLSWQDLKDMGRRFGQVSFADCNKVRKGEGILTFHDKDSMIRAKQELDGEEVKGQRIRMDYEFPETAEDDWKGDINNDHPGYYTAKSPKAKDGYDARDDRDRRSTRSPARDRRSTSPQRRDDPRDANDQDSQD